MAHLLFIFMDGVGIGSDDPTSNPFLDARLPHWGALTGGRWPTASEPSPRIGVHATVRGADATLGVPGIPQSGTGTTALLTGENAPARLGRHSGPYVPRELRELLDERNLLTRVASAGGRVTFANAFPTFYFDRLERGKARKTACTRAALGAGVALRTHEALAAGEALSPWLTNERWNRFLPEIPIITPRDAGRNLGRLALTHEVTLFEYFESDHRGHRNDIARARAALERVDDFIGGILEVLSPERDLLVIASDHGNFEAQEHGDHTTNPVLVTLRGRDHARLGGQIEKITDIVPALLAWLAIAG